MAAIVVVVGPMLWRVWSALDHRMVCCTVFGHPLLRTNIPLVAAPYLAPANAGTVTNSKVSNGAGQANRNEWRGFHFLCLGDSPCSSLGEWGDEAGDEAQNTRFKAFRSDMEQQFSILRISCGGSVWFISYQ